MQRKISDSTTLHFDDGKIVVATEQDVTDLVESNNNLRKEPQKLLGTQRHRVHVAEIPDKLMAELKRRFGPMKHNQRAWRQWLNDPDNRVFRTWHGRV